MITNGNDKPSEYYMQERGEMIACVSPGDHCVLEVGCAEGRTGARLKDEGKARVVVGLELNPEVAKVAEGNLDFVVHGNVESITIPEPYGKYDYVLAGDVLEHLVDPWSAMRKLHAALAPGGRVVFSVPNIRNWTVLFPLFFAGKWKYEEYGIMDSTHLRFFTKKSCMMLAESANFRVVSVKPAGSKIANMFYRMHLGTLVEFTAVQFVVVCEKI